MALLNYDFHCQTLEILKDIVSRYTSTDLWRTNLFQSQLSHLLWVKGGIILLNVESDEFHKTPVHTKKNTIDRPLKWTATGV
jgi:hypothetical protein